MRKLFFVLFVCLTVGVFAQQNTAPEGFVRINGGTFMMGSPANEPGHRDNEIQHQVTVSSFYMGKYELTQKEWTSVMGTTVEQQQAAVAQIDPDISRSNEYGRGDAYPMYFVSWYDALVFCNRLSMLQGLTPAYSISDSTDPDNWGTVPTSSNATWDAVKIVANSNGYRLPTETQWEYACRAGATTTYNTGNTISDNTGWYNANSNSKTYEVGKKPPNVWGLYDMHGNVSEWCWDWYGTYPKEAQTNPGGISSGSHRVLRGGGWGSLGTDIRSAVRGANSPYNRVNGLGFRLIRP